MAPSSPHIPHPPHIAEEEEIDCEVQSYFADHVNMDAANISAAAVLMNDHDSDDPQLLVCEEEMVASSKDGTPDMGEGESGVGSDHAPGERNTEWDDWGSLSIDMQAAEHDADMPASHVAGDVKE